MTPAQALAARAGRGSAGWLMAASVLLAGCATPPAGSNAAGSGARLTPVTAADPACSRPITRMDLLGNWRGWRGERPLELTLWPHAEHPIGLQGQTQQLLDGLPSITRVAGDLDHGELILEESLDGYQISGEWEGQVSAQPDPVGCLLVVRGTWHERPGSRSAPFTLQRPLR